MLVWCVEVVRGVRESEPQREKKMRKRCNTNRRPLMAQATLQRHESTLVRKPRACGGIFYIQGLHGHTQVLQGYSSWIVRNPCGRGGGGSRGVSVHRLYFLRGYTSRMVDGHCAA